MSNPRPSAQGRDQSCRVPLLKQLDSVRKRNLLLHRVIHAKPEEGKGSMGALNHPSDRGRGFHSAQETNGLSLQCPLLPPGLMPVPFAAWIATVAWRYKF